MEENKQGDTPEIKQKDWSQVSGQVAKALYMEETKNMTVVFKSGGVYSYSNVPLEVWEKSLNAASIGRFLNTDIKPHYKAVKLN